MVPSYFKIQSTGSDHAPHVIVTTNCQSLKHLSFCLFHLSFELILIAFKLRKRLRKPSIFAKANFLKYSLHQTNWRWFLIVLIFTVFFFTCSAENDSNELSISADLFVTIKREIRFFFATKNIVRSRQLLPALRLFYLSRNQNKNEMILKIKEKLKSAREDEKKVFNFNFRGNEKVWIFFKDTADACLCFFLVCINK